MVTRRLTLRQLIVRAVKCGAQTSGHISELVGVNSRRVATELCNLEAQQRVRRVGRQECSQRGRPKQLWGAK